MTAPELLDLIACYGGSVALDGDRMRYDLAGDAAPLVPELIARREEIRRLLRERTAVPPLPPGFRLLGWNLKPTPVICERLGCD